MRWLCACGLVLALSLNGCSCVQRGLPGDDDGGAPDAARADRPHDGGWPGWSDGPQYDGGPAPDARRPDGSPRPDAGPLPDAGACGYQEVWYLETRAITKVSLVNGATPRLGVTEQLLVEVQLNSGSCEDLGRVGVAIAQGNATDAVALTAFVWKVHGTVGCTADAPLATMVVAVPGREQGNLNVVVTDATSPGGGLRLTYERQPCSGVPACQCYPGAPPGPIAEHGTCVTDCSCATGLACIGYWGFAGPLWTCERPCADDRDCGWGTFCATEVADGPSYVCMLGSGRCGKYGECPVGFTCEMDESWWRYCRDDRSGPGWEPCQCDAQCAPGNRCTWDEDLADCQTPCRKDTDCPSTGGFGSVYCGPASLCVYYWE